MQHLPSIYTVINFAIMLAGLVYLTKKPVNSMLEDKHQTWKKDIEGAESLRVQTQELFDTYSAKMAKLDQDVDRILADAKVKGEHYKSNIEVQAKKTAENIIAEAKALAEQESNKASRGLQGEALSLAVESAKATLKQKISQDDQDFFVDAFIQEMEAPKHG